MATSQDEPALAERPLPARDAARRASASFMGQLMDSPTRSDDEANRLESDPGSHPFGEPSARKSKNVKFRYSATGKHLSSPLKSSSMSPERKAKSSVKPNPRPRPKVRRTPATPLSLSQPTPGPAKIKRRPKRKASFSPTRRELSPSSQLSSPLSSAPPSPSVVSKELPAAFPAFTQATQPALPAARPAPLRLMMASASKASLSQPLSTPKRKSDKPLLGTAQGAWEVGTPVWVSVDQSGAVHGDRVQPASSGDTVTESSDYMWWPAQVIVKEPLRVSLFGDFPSSSSTLRRTCTISTPSPGNILSINDESGTRRFNRSIFRTTSTADAAVDPTGSPPQKKQRLDSGPSIDDRWEEAVSSMEKASALEREGLPTLISSYASGNGSFYDSPDESDPDTSNLRTSFAVPQTVPKAKSLSRTKSTGKLKSQLSRTNFKATYTPTPRSRSVCPPDLTFQIPGELVLAQAPGAGSYYWPGKILKHLPDKYEKYQIQFLDDKIYAVSRSKFWTSEEEGFVTCLLGKWESSVMTMDDAESEDEGDANGDPDQGDDDEVPREPPPPPDEFEKKSVHAQLAYVKPVLRAILENKYVPAMAKHDAFMKGGSARAALLKAAGVRGGLDARFIKAVQRAICKWIIGDNSGQVRCTSDTNGDAKTGEDAATVAASSSLLSEPANPEPPEGEKMEGIEEAVPSGGDQPGGTEGEPPVPALQGDGSEEAPETSGTCMVVDQPEQVTVSIPDTSMNYLGVSGVGSSAPSPLTEMTQSMPSPSDSRAPEPESAPGETVAEPGPTPSDDPRQELPRPKGCDEFESLSGVEKLDYCLNVLLPEAVQQLLLWRSGDRVRATLLSDEEERTLHDLAVKKASETDWVDDVMRLREAQARLSGVDLNKVAQEEKRIVPGGTRTRPRRATISK